MDNIPVPLILALVAGATALFIFGVYLLWTEVSLLSRVTVRKRILKVNAGVTGAYEDEKLGSLIRKGSEDSPFKTILNLLEEKRLASFISTAGMKMTPGAYIAMCLGSGVAGAILFLLLFRSLSAGPFLLGLLLGMAVPFMVTKRKIAKRKEKMIEQLPDAMDYFARALRAGNPFVGAIKSGSEETPAPLSDELAVTFDEMNFGIDFDEAMRNFANRTNAEEIRLFVTAVLVQKNTGGNLAELMNRISGLLRERARTRGEIRIQAADMQSSAKVLIGLPFAIAMFLQVANPGYLGILLDSELGRTLIMVQLGMIGVGWYIMKRMINFRI
jgi:tight adherence protein B